MKVFYSQFKIFMAGVLAAFVVVFYQQCSPASLSLEMGKSSNNNVVQAIPIIDPPPDGGGGGGGTDDPPTQNCYPVVDDNNNPYHPPTSISCPSLSCKEDESSTMNFTRSIPIIDPPPDDGGGGGGGDTPNPNVMKCLKYPKQAVTCEKDHSSTTISDHDLDDDGVDDHPSEIVDCVMVCYTPPMYPNKARTMFKPISFLDILADGQSHDGYTLGHCKCGAATAPDLTCEEVNANTKVK